MPATGRAPGPARPAFVGGRQTDGQAQLEQASIWSSCCRPSACARTDYFALRLFAEILGGGMASRLFQEAREKRGLAYAIDAYSETYADAGVLGVFAGCAAKDAAETRPGRGRARSRAWPAASTTPSLPAPRPS